MGARPPFGALSRRGLNRIKLVYDPASAFNQLGQYAIAMLVAGPTLMRNSPFSSLAVAVFIVSIHYAYLRRDGQAELVWVAAWLYS